MENQICVLVHDSAPAHRSVLATDFFRKNKVTTLEIPPYSSDLAAAYFCLFTRLISALKGRRFCDANGIITLRRADHSSRGVLPTVVRRCVWSRNLANEEALAHWELSRQKENGIIKNATKELKMLLQNGFQKCFQQIYNRWQKLIVAQGNYFDLNVS